MDIDDIESTPLQLAYRKARQTAGKEAVAAACEAHGARSGMVSDIPHSRRAAALASFRKLAGGTGEASLDPVEIYARWNNPPSSRKQDA